jgi:hypothetical protein
MSGGGGSRRDTKGSAPGSADADGLGAFASETDHSAPPPAQRSVARHALESPRLVPIVVALAVIGYGSLMVVWWEREKPDVKPSFSSTPTTSFRPSAPPPSAPAPTAVPVPTAPQVAVASPGEVPDDFFIPAVARAGHSSRPADTTVTLPEPLPVPVPDAAEDVAPIAAPRVPEAPAPAAAAAPAGDAPPVTAPVRPIEPAVVDRLAADRTAIGDVLQTYRAAYNALDATSVSTIWQGLDTRALQKAFATLSQQDVVFDRCDVRVTAADHAVASCRGVLTYVPRIGDGERQQRRLSWSFDFQRAADRWVISSVSAR